MKGWPCCSLRVSERVRLLQLITVINQVSDVSVFFTTLRNRLSDKAAVKLKGQFSDRARLHLERKRERTIFIQKRNGRRQFSLRRDTGEDYSLRKETGEDYFHLKSKREKKFAQKGDRKRLFSFRKKTEKTVSPIVQVNYFSLWKEMGATSTDARVERLPTRKLTTLISIM